MTDAQPFLLALCLGGLIAGLTLLVRGFGGYRAAALVGDTSTSRIATLAAGEVRITGTVEPAELTITSPLAGRECVWYRATVSAQGDDSRTLFHEERAVSFQVADGSGSIRVFPRGARVEAPVRLDERSSRLGETPPGVAMGTRSPFDTQIAGDREAAIAGLLTVHAPDPQDAADAYGGSGSARRFEERRLEVGEVVTIVGSALPFGHLADPEGADRLDRTGDPLLGLDDPETAMDIAEARAAGILLTPEEAWGNAAIPGFGVGRPVRVPELDPGTTTPILATAAEAATIARTFDIGPDDLVIAAAPGSPLLVADGSPGEVVAREQDRFLVGLLGAVLAIGSAVAGAVLLTLPG